MADENCADRASATHEIPVHDVRNKLTIVLGFVEICLEADANGQRPERRFLEGIARATTEAASLLRQVGGAADEPVADPPPSP